MHRPEAEAVVLRGLEIVGQARRIGLKPVVVEPRTDARMDSSPVLPQATVSGATLTQQSAESLTAAARAAEQRGYETGHSKGVEAARREFAERLTRFDELLKTISRRQDDLLEVLEEDLAELTFEAATSLLGDASLRRDLVIQALRRLLSDRPDSRILTVRVAPSDLELVAGSAAASELGLGSRIKLQADTEVRLGGCIIETGRGNLDARLESRIEKLRQSLLAGRNAEAAGP